MTNIPTSGAFLRAFAGSSMTAGTRHVAEVIAGHISYDGKYRDAPKGHAAFTMAELRELTRLAPRTILAALNELAQLFGLIVTRRHHQRHFFRFTRIEGCAPLPGPHVDAEAGSSVTCPQGAEGNHRVTGNQLPTSPYIEEQGNNDCLVKVRIEEGESVWRTPWASIIERFKRGTHAENMDTQYLWAGFCGLNRRNGREQVPLRFLIGFLKKYPKKRTDWTAVRPAAAPPPSRAATIDPATRLLVELTRPAPYENRYFHKAGLQRGIGADRYEARVTAMMGRFACGRFQAELAVHGEAVSRGEIDR